MNVQKIGLPEAYNYLEMILPFPVATSHLRRESAFRRQVFLVKQHYVNDYRYAPPLELLMRYYELHPVYRYNSSLGALPITHPELNEAQEVFDFVFGDKKDFAGQALLWVAGMKFCLLLQASELERFFTSPQHYYEQVGDWLSVGFDSYYFLLPAEGSLYVFESPGITYRIEAAEVKKKIWGWILRGLLEKKSAAEDRT